MRGCARNMKKILVVNVNWLGDVIFSSPVFRSLRTAYPSSHITCFAVPRVREVVESIPDVDEVIVYDEDGADRSLLAKLRIIGRLKREKFDAVFLLSKSFSRASMMKLAGIPIRVGYDNKKRGRLLSHIAKGDVHAMHRSDYYLGVIKSFGIPVDDPSNYLDVSNDDRKRVAQILDEHGYDPSSKLIGLNPGGNWDLKRWPSENFIRLADRLGEHADYQLVFTGAAKDGSLVRGITQGMQSSRPPLVLTGQLTLRQLMALMEVLDVFVTADSGPLHIASSLGCRTVSLFGPTRPEITGPRGRGANISLQKDVGCNRRACYHLECRDNICMKAINVEDVYAAVESIQDS